MSDREPPFICYKRGWAIQIVPRNAAGWRATALWLIPFLAINGLFIFGCAAMEANGATGDRIGLVMVPPLVVAVAAWAVLMIRWMKARSEIVDLEDGARGKQAHDRRPKPAKGKR